MAFDVAYVRGLFPSLGDGWIHFDPQAGMQVPDSVATAVSRGYRQLTSSPGGVYPAARAAAEAVSGARRAIADLVAADPRGVVLGSSRSSLLSLLAESLLMTSPRLGDVVVSAADDNANIDPWVRMARRSGWSSRWAEIDVETGVLPSYQYAELITESTAVVAVTLASSTTGLVTDIAPIAERAREADALLVVDATSAAPYMTLDIEEIGADVLVVSAERWGGPRIASMVFRSVERLERMASVSPYPKARGAARLELEPLQGGLLAGVVASIEHLANLDESSIGKRRRRLVLGVDGMAEYLDRLTYYLQTTLQHLNQVHIFGQGDNRIPVLSFVFENVTSDKVVRRLADNGICALANVPSLALERMGANDFGGAVTVGLGPYSTPYEVDHLVRTLGSLG